MDELKFYISALPAYSTTQISAATDEKQNSDLSAGHDNILLTYDRNEASSHLDDMIRLYISEHNALYQGIIYLNSPYKMLAYFSLFLAFSFDIAGFIFGFVIQGSESENRKRKKIKKSAAINTSDEEENTNSGNEDFFQKETNDDELSWSIVKPINTYIIITGDYTKKDTNYIYDVFINGKFQKWTVEDDMPYEAGVYIQDKVIESKGALIVPAEQELKFTNQTDGPQDGIYLNCSLVFEDGGLNLIQESEGTQFKRYLATVNEYVPVHSYNSSKNEIVTFPAEQLAIDDKVNINARMAILSLNDRGTRMAAIYIIQS